MNNHNLGDRLQSLRSQHGYSQEQLADLVGVSRQAVSKWETGASMPDLDNLVRLSVLYNQTLDSIVKGTTDDPEGRAGSGEAPVIDLGTYTSDLIRVRLHSRHYEYKSATTLFGLPLLHINVGRKNGKLAVAKGIVAVGTVAVGGVSVGIFSLGLLSVGILALGSIALGTLCAGIFSGGILAVGVFSFGTVAIGYLATGVASMGIYTGGVASMGAKVAVGVAAAAPVAVGKEAAEGLHSLLVTSSVDTAYLVRTFIERYAPETSNYILNHLVWIATHL